MGSLGALVVFYIQGKPVLHYNIRILAQVSFGRIGCATPGKHTSLEVHRYGIP